MKKWKTLAPNGKSVTLAKDSFTDITLFHRQKISDEELASRYPNIFIPCVPEEELIKTVVSDEEKQMLTEVPKVEDPAPEDDKPVVDPGTTIEDEDEDVNAPDDDEDGDEDVNAPDDDDLESLTKKVLIKMAEDKKIELPKYANKTTIIELLKG